MSPERRVSGLVSGSALCREKLVHAMNSRLEDASAKVQLSGKELVSAAMRRSEHTSQQVLRMREKLEAINPLRILERGYTLVSDLAGRVLSESRQAREAGNVRIRFADGIVEAAVKKEDG